MRQQDLATRSSAQPETGYGGFAGDTALAIARTPREVAVSQDDRRASLRRTLLRECRLAACAFIPVLAVLVPRDNSLATVALALLVGAIWLFAIDVANSSTWFSPLALGSEVTSALGVVAAIPVIILLDDLVPGGGISFGELAVTTVAVAASVIGFWGFASGKPDIRRLIVVGTAAGGSELVRELQSHPSLPFECLGLVTQPSNGNGADHGNPNGSGPVHVLGTVAELTEIAVHYRPHLLVLAGCERNDAMTRLLDACPSDLRVVSLPDFYEHAFGRVPVEHVSPVWFMSMLHLYRRPYSRLVKRLLDVVVATVALLVCLPILPLIALLVRRSGPGPILYRQVRVGEGGQHFQILKFRTMVQNAELPGRPVWAVEHDERVTPIGRVLRKSRLDELPQLWNVLRGDMSIVGPRPERPEFVSTLQHSVPNWTRRHLVKPGITGWAQVRIGYTSDAVTAVDKLSYDLYYLKHRSLVLDLAIAALTARVIFSGSGAK